jgi:hypothetical protein
MRRRGAVLPTLILHILTAATLIAAAVFSGPAQAEKRVALVVGNDRYANLPADKQLLKAVKDAEAVGDALATLGFTVIRGQNLGRQGIIDKLSAFTAQLEPGDTAAFFYAGHGVAIGGVNYLVPSDVPEVTPDAEARVRGNSVAEGDIVGEIQAKGTRVAVLVIDACRDNPFPRSGTRSIGNTRGLADAKPARGVFTIYSAGIGQTALDRLFPNDPDPNSVFTRVFVQQLAHADRRLVDMVVEMREQVAELALKARDDAGRPEPHEQTPAYYDQTIGGHIYLTTAAPSTIPVQGERIATARVGVPPALPPGPTDGRPITDNAGLGAVLTEFGLDGTFSPDCTQSFRLFFTAYPEPGLTIVASNSERVLRREVYKSATLVNSGTLLRLRSTVTVANTPFDVNRSLKPLWPAVGEEWESLIERDKNVFKFLNSHRTDGSKVYIRNGRPEHGPAIPSFRKC